MPPPLTSLLLGFERYTVRQTEVRGSLDNVITFHVMKCTTNGCNGPVILTSGMLMKWTTPYIHDDNAFDSSDDASYSSSSPGSSNSLALDDIPLLCLSPGEGAFIRRAAIK